MNPEHLKEQAEAVEAASQQLELRKHQLHSTHWSGWLASIALLTAIVVPVWLYPTEHPVSREDAAYNPEIEGLKVFENRQQDQIASLRNDSARQEKISEKVADQERVQAAQIATLRAHLSEQQARQAQLEQVLRELVLGRAEDKRQLEQLMVENKALQEQLAANDNAQAKQANLVQELQEKMEDKKQETAHKHGFLRVFHNK